MSVPAKRLEVHSLFHKNLDGQADAVATGLDTRSRTLIETCGLVQRIGRAALPRIDVGADENRAVSAHVRAAVRTHSDAALQLGNGGGGERNLGPILERSWRPRCSDS
jgi:hypothetical protein